MTLATSGYSNNTLVIGHRGENITSLIILLAYFVSLISRSDVRKVVIWPMIYLEGCYLADDLSPTRASLLQQSGWRRWRLQQIFTFCLPLVQICESIPCTEHVLRALNSLETTEEKLAALCKKYTDLLEEHRVTQSTVKQNHRKLSVVSTSDRSSRTTANSLWSVLVIGQAEPPQTLWSVLVIGQAEPSANAAWLMLTLGQADLY